MKISTALFLVAALFIVVYAIQTGNGIMHGEYLKELPPAQQSLGTTTLAVFFGRIWQGFGL